MSLMNKLANANNPFQNQNKHKRVLAVCSAGLLRSATASVVLQNEPYNFNVRCVGLNPDFALIDISDVLLEWCDEIVCMSLEQYDILAGMTKKPIINLDIKDNYEYRDPQLIELIKKNYDKKAK